MTPAASPNTVSMALWTGLQQILDYWIQFLIILGGIGLVACLCSSAFKTSLKLRRAKASRLANDLDMELLASDNPNTLIVAGEINDRPSTIRYQNDKTSLDHIRSGFAKTPVADSEELLVSVQCDCEINFLIVKAEAPLQDSEDIVPIALLASSGLSLHSKQKEKAAFLFEELETVQSLIDLFETSGASKIDLQANKVEALIHEPEDSNRSPARVSAILEKLDKFARLLEFLADEEHHTEN